MLNNDIFNISTLYTNIFSEKSQKNVEIFCFMIYNKLVLNFIIEQFFVTGLYHTLCKKRKIFCRAVLRPQKENESGRHTAERI